MFYTTKSQCSIRVIINQNLNTTEACAVSELAYILATPRDKWLLCVKACSFIKITSTYRRRLLSFEKFFISYIESHQFHRRVSRDNWFPLSTVITHLFCFVQVHQSFHAFSSVFITLQYYRLHTNSAKTQRGLDNKLYPLVNLLRKSHQRLFYFLLSSCPNTESQPPRSIWRACRTDNR